MVGSLAAMTATSLTYPLDTAKARLSISSKEEYANLRAVFKVSYRSKELCVKHSVYVAINSDS